MTVRDVLRDICAALSMFGFVVSFTWYADILTTMAQP